MMEGCQILDSDFRYVYINEVAAKHGKKTIEEFIGKKMTILYPGIEKTEMFRKLQECQQTRIPQKLENEFIYPDNTKRTFQLNIQPHAEGILILSLDMTEKKIQEETLFEQAALLNLTHDAMAIMVRNFSDDTITFWNNSAEKIYGWKAAEAMGKDAKELLFREDSEIFDIAKKTTTQNGKWSGEFHQIDRWGKEVILESRWSLIRDKNGEPKSILVVNTNVTEFRKLEKQFLRAQRMESLGAISSGIAHDLNNILSPIKLASKEINESYKDAKTEKLIDMLNKSVDLGTSLVRQILIFSRGNENGKIKLDTKKILLDFINFIENIFPSNIIFDIKIDGHLHPILADATQLNQILLNLAINARDAMPDGGTISIVAHNFEIMNKEELISPEAKPGIYVVLSVSDTGYGMPPEILKKIFEPFFTTKGDEKGTGLGLSTVASILKNHNGFFHVYSEVGTGTVFKLYFPALKEKGMDDIEKFQSDSGDGNGERILLVDDEFAIREILKLALESRGYSVITASDGIEAIALFSRQINSIDLVISDMQMPNMDGSTLVWSLQKMKPDLPAILTSGLSGNKQSNLTDLKIKATLQKPYTTEELLLTIKKALASEKSQK